jgi:hypothetical protein
LRCPARFVGCLLRGWDEIASLPGDIKTAAQPEIRDAFQL